MSERAPAYPYALAIVSVHRRDAHERAGFRKKFRFSRYIKALTCRADATHKNCYHGSMLKNLFVMVLMVAVAFMGLPTASFAASNHGKPAMTMENCDCPPGKSMNDMPCHQDGGCPPSLDCLTHCSVAPPLATPAMPLRMLALLPQQPALFVDSPGKLISSTYPPYRPPSI